MKNVLRKLWLHFSILIFVGFGATQLQADEDHYKNMLIGERAATMGGSYAVSYTHLTLPTICSV